MQYLTPSVLATIAVVVFIALIIAVWLVVRYRKPHRQFERIVRKLAISEWQQAVVPDSVDGFLQIDRLLLTDKGVLVVMFKDVDGTVFAGERLDEWAVMRSHRRFPFTNPLGALQDRIAAVHALVPSLPVDGRVVFSNTAQFPKGRPEKVCVLSELEKWPKPGANVAQYQALWQGLREQTESIGREINRKR